MREHRGPPAADRVASTGRRERELAVRAALGGSRRRLVRQLLTESLLLAGLAIALGLGLAWLGVRLLLSLAPENLPRLDHVSVDPTVAGFAALAGLTSAIMFGLIPALRASRPDLMELLRRSGRTGGLATGGWVRYGIATTAVALSFVLLVGSGLMIRSFVALQRAEPGYDPNGVLTFFIPQLRLPEEKARQAFMRDLKTRVEALPGVLGATAASPLPLDGREGLARWGPEEALVDATKFQQATFHFVLPGYFQVMKTRVIEGRTFTEADNTRDARVAVIDRVLAAKAFSRAHRSGRRCWRDCKPTSRNDSRSSASSSISVTRRLPATVERRSIYRTATCSMDSRTGGRCARAVICCRSPRRSAPPWRISTPARASSTSSRCRRS